MIAAQSPPPPSVPHQTAGADARSRRLLAPLAKSHSSAGSSAIINLVTASAVACWCPSVAGGGDLEASADSTVAGGEWGRGCLGSRAKIQQPFLSCDCLNIFSRDGQKKGKPLRTRRYCSKIKELTVRGGSLSVVEPCVHMRAIFTAVRSSPRHASCTQAKVNYKRKTLSF